ncbi:MAG: hypothetical protein ACO223_08310 [Burkholderiaceae bacterium]|jgi:hypothetical protein|nr:hypothetical protein [Burkholderiaceae bacterium]MBU6291877.1 hypothetical protein [Burkholderiales bacterium]NCV85461.1 hypothetical protein [Oxalobacteraceae bacterium]NCW87156.1 hypothetical protein [Oxalobacteraceae bacterium]NDG07691.1 hypothetical protein [Oxalobacteraceae bacterium]
MWKMLVAFIIFAAVALAAVFNMGDKASLQGEAGGHGDSHSQAPAAAAPATAPAATEAPAAPASADSEKK